jgi:effector-binding domain-containing protein
MLKHAETGAMARRKTDLRAVVRHADERVLGVMQVRVELARFRLQIMRCLDDVEDYLKQASVQRARRGEAVVVYHGLLWQDSPVDIGIEVTEPFESRGDVVCSKTPAGSVATAVHYGAYDGLRTFHTLLRQWCADNGHELTGTAWEIYRELDLDPDRRKTEILYQLK